LELGVAAVVVVVEAAGAPAEDRVVDLERRQADILPVAAEQVAEHQGNQHPMSTRLGAPGGRVKLARDSLAGIPGPVSLELTTLPFSKGKTHGVALLALTTLPSSKEPMPHGLNKATLLEAPETIR
jgi:hypothetical protein